MIRLIAFMPQSVENAQKCFLFESTDKTGGYKRVNCNRFIFAVQTNRKVVKMRDAYVDGLVARKKKKKKHHNAVWTRSKSFKFVYIPTKRKLPLMPIDSSISIQMWLFNVLGELTDAIPLFYHFLAFPLQWVSQLNGFLPHFFGIDRYQKFWATHGQTSSERMRNGFDERKILPEPWADRTFFFFLVGRVPYFMHVMHWRYVRLWIDYK